MAVIYQITNKINGKYYIGSTQRFERRVWQHRYALKAGKHKNPRLQASWNKHGAEAFVFEVVEKVPDGGSQLKYEDKYLAGKVGLPECYNINTSAELSRAGLKHSKESKKRISVKVQAALAEGRGGKFIPTTETRRKMSEALKGNQCAKGAKRSEAEREAIRQRMRGNQHWAGKAHSEESVAKMSRPVLAIKPDGSREEFIGMTTMCKKFGVALPTIIRACRTGKPVSTGALSGWMLSYADGVEVNAPLNVPGDYKDLPRTRQLAKAGGSKLYFTGTPCSRGHTSPPHNERRVCRLP